MNRKTLRTAVGVWALVALAGMLSACASVPQMKPGEPYGEVRAEKPIYLTSIDGSSVKPLFQPGIESVRLVPGDHTVGVAYHAKSGAMTSRSTNDITSTIKVEEGLRHVLKLHATNSSPLPGSFRWTVKITEEVIEDYGSPAEVAIRKESLDYGRAARRDSILLYQEFLSLYPDGRHNSDVRKKLETLQKERRNAIARSRLIPRESETTIPSLPDEVFEGVEYTLTWQPSLVDSAERLILSVSDKGKVVFKVPDGQTATGTFSGGGSMKIDESRAADVCLFCAETILLAGDQVFPVGPREALITGPDGAFIKRVKGGKDIICVEGLVYLQRKD